MGNDHAERAAPTGEASPDPRKEQPVSHPYSTALQQFLKHVAPPWSKPQRGNFLRLASAFLKRRSLPLRRLARSETGPQKTCRPLDRRFRRFLGSDRLHVPATL